MQAEWIIRSDGKELGPLTLAQVQQMAAAGQVLPGSPLRRLKDTRWFAAGKVPGLFPQAAQPQAPPLQPSPPTAVNPAAAKLAVAKPLSGSLATAKAVSPAVDVVPPPLAPPPPPVPPPPPIMAAPAPPPLPPVPPTPGFDLAANPGFPIISTDRKGSGKANSKQTVAKPVPLPSAEPGAPPVAAKKQRQFALVAGLACVATVVGAGGLLAVYLKSQPAAAEKPTPPLASATSTENLAKAPAATEAGGNPGDGNPTSGNPVVAETVVANRPAAAPSGAASASSAPAVSKAEAAQQKTIKSIRTWRNAALVKSLKLSAFRLEIVRCWCEGSVAEETGADAADAPPAKPTQLFVEVRLTNTSAAPLKIQSWNSPATQAIFAAANDRILPLRDASGVPATIAAGASLVQTLVCEAGDLDNEPVRLALPHSALYSSAKDYFAYELTAEVYLRDKQSPTTGTIATSTPDGAAAPNSNTIEGLNQQIEMLDESGSKKEKTAARKPAATPPAAAADPTAAKMADGKMADAKMDPTDEESPEGKPDAKSKGKAKEEKPSVDALTKAIEDADANMKENDPKMAESKNGKEQPLLGKMPTMEKEKPAAKTKGKKPVVKGK